MTQTRKTDLKSLMPELMSGKLPPQAVDLEEAVLGALMLEKWAIEVVQPILAKDEFYKDAHQFIYEAIMGLSAKNEPVDILTTTNALRSSGKLDLCGGPYYITQLTNRVASAANIEYHARIIHQIFLKRELIRIGGEMQRSAFEESGEDVFETISTAEAQIAELTSGQIGPEKSLDQQVKAAIEQVQRQQESGGVAGYSTGLKAVDSISSGFRKGELIVIAARPGMGKSAFAGQVALNLGFQQVPSYILSLEMVDLQIVNRMLANLSGVYLDKISSGNMNEYDWRLFYDASDRLSRLPIKIDDTPAEKIESLRSKAKRYKKKYNEFVLFVDYLQLMDGKKPNEKNGNLREQEIAYISRSLKTLAKELDIPVVALAQLSRAVETRGGDKRPMLSDLRESGSIEQDADMVIFPYRPEYYGFTTDDMGNPLNGITIIIIAKNRNGKTDEAQIKFIGALQKFEDLSVFNTEQNPL